MVLLLSKEACQNVCVCGMMIDFCYCYCYEFVDNYRCTFWCHICCGQKISTPKTDNIYLKFFFNFIFQHFLHIYHNVQSTVFKTRQNSIEEQNAHNKRSE